MTGPYIGGARSATVTGARAAPFIALGLGPMVPVAFREQHRLVVDDPHHGTSGAAKRRHVGVADLRWHAEPERT